MICDGTDANAEVVRAGMAWAFTKYLTDPQIKAIEMEARAERRGLWVDREPVAQWGWRQSKGEQPPRWRPATVLVVKLPASLRPQRP